MGVKDSVGVEREPLLATSFCFVPAEVDIGKLHGAPAIW